MNLGSAGLTACATLKWVRCDKVAGVRAVLLVFLAVIGAFAQKVNVEFDPGANFARYRTFAIRGGQLSSRNPALNGELVKKRIEADIVNGLTARGLAFVPQGPADLNVRYTFGAAARMETEAYPAGWRGWGTRVVRVPYAEGTLVIDLRDAGTRGMVWRGIASVEKNEPRKIEGKIDDMVRKALYKYPPKPR